MDLQKKQQSDLVIVEEENSYERENVVENIGDTAVVLKNAKVIEWEDYEQELARFCSLSSAINEAKQKKFLLEQKLQSLIQVETESLSRSNELDEMRERLESRKLSMGNMSMKSKVAEEKLKRQEEQLTTQIRSLLVAGAALSGASKRLMDDHRSFAGENGYLCYKTAQKFLKLRQQYMVSQICLLYPVKLVVGQKHEQELESFTSSIKPGAPAGSRPLDQESLTIADLHLTVIPSTKMSFFSDKKEVQCSATALGYVAHAVTLIASYLQVPLRYPLRLGGSRSYIRDYAPSIESLPSESTSNSSTPTNTKPIEFPLFLKGQDSTRAAYGVFLLNKDLEQLLNYIGVKSLGPRHVLANLKELLKTILSPEYIDT